LDELSDDGIGYDILVSIVNYRTAGHCISCLTSLAAACEALRGLRVVVADGASGDGSVEILEDWIADNGHKEWINVLPLTINGGFGWAHNQVIIDALKSENPPSFIYLLNPDTIVYPGAVEALRRVFDRDPRIACVGSQLVNVDGTLGGSAFRFPGLRRELAKGTGIDLIRRLLGLSPDVVFTTRVQQVDWVTGASVMIRLEALKQVGLFDDGFFLYWEEVELMHRMMRAGWSIWHEPNSRVVHEGGASTGVETGNIRPQRRLPQYCYISQRRYFALTSGSIKTNIAELAWLTGRLVGTVLKFLLHRPRKGGVPFELSDKLSAGLFATQSDLTPGNIYRLSDGQLPPAWIKFYGAGLSK
jgi:hypothetical protein